MGTVSVSAAVTQNNPTNASLTVSFSGPSIANLSLFWGNTTNYGFSQYNNHTTTSWNIFLDYLEPATTYDYKAAAANGCWTTGTTTGSWKTAPESNYLNANGIVIKGTVTDSSGTKVPANANLAVEVQCTGYNGGSNDFQSVYFITNSQGTYSINVASGGEPLCSYYYHQGFVVQVLNTPAWYPLPYGVYSGQWTGRWNETIVVWAPQVVNFKLPLNYVSPYFPAVLDFSDAPAGYSTIGFEQGTTSSFTTEMTYSWSLGAGAGVLGITGSGTTLIQTTFTVGSTGSIQSTNGNLDYIVQQETTGMVEFDAINRGWAVPQTTLFGPFLNGEPAQQNSNFVQPKDWLIGNGSSYPLTSALGKVMSNVYLNTQGFFYGGSITTSTTVAVGSSYSVTFGLSLTLPGAGTFSASDSAGWSQTSSTTYTDTLNWQVGEPNGGSAVCINVLGQGGAGTYADVLSIHTWTPVEGACT